MKIARGRSVELSYELKVKGGSVIESSTRSGPLRYVHGDGKMLPGLEKRLEELKLEAQISPLPPVVMGRRS